ncbi:D-alanyl-D-alanine carboxypeptidase [Mucilaginibacter pineti]|uniref:D-alanyl-D-alanine carboxypeptidase n=1 Tax=Mucilaginibacter pineti TaxID=1391627 RepID=A0A1G7ING8_9SPHI|nr:serine hydrolase domain-containing protein [Mucilaginibacter pineti]SDF13849.1 D-alanyl-D-alanine carboxypeptidase [Mucilaginibacter pineti]
MKNSSLSYLLIFLLFFSSCKKSDAQDSSKDPKKHAQPSLAVFPDGSIYDIGAPLNGSLKDSLDQTVRRLFAITVMPGLTAAILVPGKGLWQTDTGYLSKPGLKKADAGSVFYWASVCKLLTATVIEQLINEQKLQHDSKLSVWFPKLHDAGKITIDELLEHTSGIYSFNNDPTIFDIDRYYSPDELIGLSQGQKNLFPPGKTWSYSNTNYLLLALIAENIEGKSFDEIIQQRIALPLHLTSLHALKPHEQPDNLALAHENGAIVKEDYSVPLGAGNVVSNARDMVVLLYSLMTGKLGPVLLVHDRLKDLYAMPDAGTWYGSGMMLTDFNEITHTDDLWIGHSGGTQTYRALLVYDTATKTFIALAINQHVSVEAVARKLLSVVH